MKALTVIITTRNRLAYTKRTIDSLMRTVPQADFIIYDDYSSEYGMLDYLSGLSIEYPESVSTIFGNENIGMGAGINRCLMEKTALLSDYVLISNNDVEYKDGWFEKGIELYEKYPNIGILGVWKHAAHGVLKDMGDLIIKDQMPAVGWLMKKSVIDKIGLFSVHGPCSTKGGNGEDVDYCLRVGAAGLWVCGPKEDTAVHLDGY